MGEGAGGEEVFEGDAVVGAVVGDGADDATLIVGGAGDWDAGGFAEGGRPTFGGDDEAARQRGAAGDGDGGAFGSALDLGLGWGEKVEVGELVQPGVQGDTEAAGLDHPTEGAGVGVLVFEV